ncbi:sulfatase-like hydrolase/transferase [Labilibacter marinus]|uniref:sulfatase-like hydrolase/transferase n=1 Tax=Labilibacter marinus TaxID=1477105 RepID=UPI000A48FA6F
MKFFILLFTILLTFTGCKKETSIDDALKDEENPTELPNILFIIADDMGIDACPGYTEGDRKPSMPHLESLASTGITFDKAWAYPVCSPTRASVLTGKYGSRTGILSVDNSHISESETSIQRYLDLNTDSAYSHAVIGKWHLSKLNQFSAPNDMAWVTLQDLCKED